MFRRKGLLRKELIDSLITLLTVCKDDWLNKKRVIESSIDPSEEVLYRLRLSEAKYLFLLKEVRELHLYHEQNHDRF
ncbi:YaaL family protein [Terrilactibacillus sp. S3-3]|nr:YaaL family protein [Terrilactibacillus sp. S3-3]